MNICICDPDAKNCIFVWECIKRYLQKKSLTANVFIYHSLHDLYDSEEIFELIFMEVEFNDGNGLKGMIQSQQYREAKIVFVTSHEEEVFNGYKAGAFRFLLKPIQYGDVAEVLDGIYESIAGKENVRISSGKQKICLNSADIVYLESDNKNVGIRTTSDFITVRGTLAGIAKQLDPDIFCSPHRSYLVNMNYIASVEQKHVVMKNGEKIPISRLKKEDFVNRYSK